MVNPIIELAPTKNLWIMEEKPKLKLTLTTVDKTFEVVGWLLVIALWSLVAFSYADLPENVPTHYNGAGRADGYGEKASILTLPILASILYLGLTIFNKFPHLFIYPTHITKDNVFKQYTNATRLLRYLKLTVVFILGIIVCKSIENASKATEGLGIWFMPICAALIFVPATYFVVKSYKMA